MKARMLHVRVPALAAFALFATGCADEVVSPKPAVALPLLSRSGRGNDDDARPFRFEPLPASAVCGSRAAFPEKPFLLPPGFEQVAFAREGDGGTRDLWDMHTQNEKGVRAGRYLYRTHEVGANGQLSVTDLSTLERSGGVATSQTRVIAERMDWERLDGIVWTPWGTILAAEETNRAAARDPQVPQAEAGLVYEFFLDLDDPSKLDPSRERIVPGDGTNDVVRDGIRARPAIGSRSHEGLRFDAEGNLYGIAESSPPTGGYIYRFVPDRKGDLSTGQLYALRIVRPDGERTGQAIWVALDRGSVQVNSDRDATAKQATGYGRPEDVEISTSTGSFDSSIMFVAITSENRVLGVDLDVGRSRGRGHDGGDDDDRRRHRRGRDGGTAYVFDYVRAGMNAPADFASPDNLALDRSGNLYIAEDPSTPPGADLWVAVPGRSSRGAAMEAVRFASLSDCAAEPSGIYFDVSKSILYVTVQHRGQPDTRDLSMMIYPARNNPEADDDRDGGRRDDGRQEDGEQDDARSDDDDRNDHREPKYRDVRHGGGE